MTCHRLPLSPSDLSRGLFGAATAKLSILFVQALPALIALGLAFATRERTA